MTTTLDRNAAQVLEAVAAAYRDCRAALEAVREPWLALRDPNQPWEQNLLLLHDRHQNLLRTAREVENSLSNACEFYADQRALDYHERNRSLVKHLERHPDIKDSLSTIGLHPEYPVPLEEYAPHHVIEHYPLAVRVEARAEELIKAQRAYIHAALNPR